MHTKICIQVILFPFLLFPMIAHLVLMDWVICSMINGYLALGFLGFHVIMIVRNLQRQGFGKFL